MTTSKEFKLWGAPRRLWECLAPRILLDGPARTGKTWGDCVFSHAMAMGNPGARILWVRENRTSMSESVMQTFEDFVLEGEVKRLFGVVSRPNRQSYDYANGAKIVLGGLDQPEKLYSTEWDIVIVFEAIETKQDDVERFTRGLSGRGIPLRQLDGTPILWPDGTPIYRRQLIMETNPGSPGNWLNQLATKVPPGIGPIDTPGQRRALDAWNRRRPEATLCDPPEVASRPLVHRLLSRHCDNPRWFNGNDWTADGRSLMASLASMTEHRRARLFEGRWVSASGSVYPEFNESVHVVESFEPDADWPQYVGIDPGFDHPTACLFFTVSPDGGVYLFDEHYRNGWTIKQHCEEIKRRIASNGRNVRMMFADPQQWFNKTAAGSCDQQARECGLKFHPWSRTITIGSQGMVEAVRQLLVNGAKTPEVSPYIKVCRNCTNTITEFQTWAYKRTASGELPAGDDAFVDANNHSMDVIKGMVSSGIFRYNPANGPVPDNEDGIR